MINIRNLIAVLCVAAVPIGAYAQSKEEHQEHHPAGAAAATQGNASPRSMGADRMAAMDQHMKAMQAMREKMAAAKTPAERQALMAEHMKVMQEGMTMMGQMRGMSGMQGMQGVMQSGSGMAGNMAERQQMMEKRVEMMESMMQMMMDRLPWRTVIGQQGRHPR
ncbi:hypothetical protein [Rhodoferax sp. BAB1]|uniref:hypothetical protein n=1 Tax=Rhodoferax sp. BAB1 TaxID=2741720 RepID=UPI001576CB4D|nr:hypothetical protein [Rhodoferax sp. BAB1]QKO20534.1 hypothetical protein HTY51_00850 [Rhodoferax sp. BAB1]